MRHIKGFEGLYAAKENGDIVSLKNNKVIVLTGGKNHGGYRTYSLRKDGIQFQYLGHRLVALAFLDNPQNKPEVNHKDGNKLNNSVENLEWNTKSENLKHAYAKGLLTITDEHLHKMRTSTGENRALFTLTDAENIRHIYGNIKGVTCKRIANVYGCSVSTIKRIVNGTQKVFKKDTTWLLR